MTLSLAFHHFGLAVAEPERACRFLSDLGYRVGESLLDPEQNVFLIWSEHDVMPAVEVVYPCEGGGSLDVIVKQRDSMVYHICYSCDDLGDAVEAIKERGHRVVQVTPPKPAILFGGCRVGFYLIKGFGLIVLVERKKIEIK